MYFLTSCDTIGYHYKCVTSERRKLMKQETAKKSKKWLWIVLAIVAVLVAAAVAVAFLLPRQEPVEQPQEEETPHSEIYWNLDRIKFTQDSETGLSTREKDPEDKLVHLRFASNGQLLNLATADRQLVNYIDTMDACGLIFDADGLIIDAMPINDFAVETAKSFYVKQITGNTVVVNSSIALNGMDITFQVTDDVYVMDVRQETETPAQVIGLEVMDTVSVYGTEENPATCVFLMERTPASEPYLRINRMYSSATGATTRVPDENGIYTIPFALNGEILELKCKDVAVVTEIDLGSGAKSVMGLTFDEEGYITGTIVAATAMRGKLLCNEYDVTAVNGNSFEVSRLLSGTEQGKVANFTLTEETVIVMNEADCGHFIGEVVPEIKANDRLNVWTDADNNAKYITVERRMAPEGTKMYYNVRKQYNSSTKETKRVPDENGYYVFELIGGGNSKIITAKTKDKALASKVDSATYSFFGLKMQGNIIKEYYEHQCVAGGSRHIVGNRFVTQVVNPILQIAGVNDFDVYNNFMISPSVEIYDATGYPGTKMGSKTELRVGDRVVGAANVYGEVTHIFVLDRYQKGATVYYRADTMYDTTTYETTRVPDEEGYYVYTMFANGKEYTFKTKSKEMADYIDTSSPHIALKVSNGIIKNAYSSIAAAMYSTMVFSTNFVESISEDKVVKCYYVLNGVRTDAPKELKMAKDCQVINVSSNYQNYRGEKTTLKPGDRIVALKDYQKEELTHIWITNRALNSPPYFHVQRQYADGQTTRVPDADGYYKVELFADGKIKTFKTKDKELMSRVDQYGQEAFFAMRTNGDIIEAVDAVTGSKYAASAICSQFDVMKISGKTITAEKMRPGTANYGTVATFTYDSNTKIYDVCPYSPNRFKPAKLEKGDRINVYTDSDGNISYIFILYTCERKNGPISKCSHCNKTVWWEPWYGSRIDSVELVHFYVPTDYVRGQGTVSRDKNNYPDTLRNTVVYDMNGCTLGSTSRNFLVYGDMIIIDSVGGGVLEAQGASDTAIGGNFLVIGGSVSVYDGVTIRQAKDPNGAGSGGNFYINNLYVKDADGNVTETYYGKVSIYDAVIEAWPGVGTDHFLLNPDTELNIKGGTIKGGTIQVNGTGTVNWTGGKIESNISLTGTTMKVPAKPNMIGLMLISNGGKLDISNLSADASIPAMPSGVFTTERNDIDKYLKVFKPAVDSITIVKEGKALSAQVNMPAMGDDLQFVPGTNLAVCPTCEGFVAWTPITQAEYGEKIFGVPSNGLHLYLAEDINCKAADVFMTSPSASGNNMYSACLHLNGHNLTTADRTFGGSRGRLNVMGSGVVTGNGTSYGAVAYINTDVDLGGGIFLQSGTYTKPAGNEQPILQINSNGGRIQLGADAKIVTPKNTVAAKLAGGALINANMVLYGTVEGGFVQSIAASARKDGAATYVALVIDGANIEGGVKVDPSTVLALRGDAKIGGIGLDLTAGAMIAVSELTENASVMVKANGAFTGRLANADQQALYYAPAVTHLPIEVREGVLWTDRDPNAPDFVDEPAIPAKPALLSVDNSDLKLDANNQAMCPVCNKMVTWVAITKVESTLEMEGDTHYYLANDITYEGTGEALSYKVLSRIQSCLHLNGHNITATNARAIFAGGYLNVMGNGIVSGNSTDQHRGATLDLNHVYGQLSLYGGTYVKSGLGTDNPIINIHGNGGTLNIFDGVIVDGSKVTKSAAIRTWAGLLNIYGGTITGGVGNAVEARNWSAAASGSFNVFGGTIQGGLNSVYCGGNSTAYGNMGLYGGNIVGNATFTPESNVVIAGNPVIAKLEMRENALFTLGVLTEGASITVTSANGVFTRQCENVDTYAKYFTAAPGMMVYVKDYAIWGEKDATYVPDLVAPEGVNDALVFAEGTTKAMCPVCKIEVEWTAITQETHGETRLGTLAAEGGMHFYLAEDVTYTGTGDFVQAPQATNKTGCFHLNGHNFTATQARPFFGNSGILNVMGNGIVTGGTNGNGNAATVGINTGGSGGKINLYGGTYTKLETCDTSAVIFINANGGKIDIYKDVKVIGLGSKPAITVVGSALVPAILNVDGAVIEGELRITPDAKVANRVNKDFQVNLKNASVTSVVLNSLGKLTVAGDTVITKLTVETDAKFNVGALGENASIDVSGEGVLTTAGTHVTNGFSKFTSSYGYVLSVVDGALVATKAE